MVWKLAQALVTSLLAIVLWSEALYVTNDSVLFAWDRTTEGDQAETYEVVVVWEGASGVRQEFAVGETEALQMLIERPRVGFFSFKVRARNVEGVVSDWAVSTDPDKAIVDGLPRGWRVFFELGAPSGGGVA